MITAEQMSIIVKRERTKVVIRNEPRLINILRKTDPDIIKLGKYDSVDIFSPKYYQYLELKCRKGNWYKWGIEKDKYDKIILYPNIRYVVWGENGIFSWDLYETPVPRWEWTYGPVSTDFNNKNWEWKWVGFVDIKYATDLSYLL